jgi:two-component system, LytTR family, response regulator
MPQETTTNPSAAGQALREAAVGFLFWLGFVLILEPGNLVRAAHAGLEVSWFNEALRMACAGLAGAPTWPLLSWLSRRLPVRGPGAPRNAVLLLVCIVMLAGAMILLGALASRWLPPTTIRGGLGDQLAGNLMLLIAALAVLTAGAQFRLGSKPGRGRIDGEPGPAPSLERIPVKARGGTLLLATAELDWIEAQGNYLALHVGPAEHLIRETLSGLEARLDPSRFVRIHRGAMVNLDRVRQVSPLGNGDAVIRLDTGAELRLSRKHRQALLARIGG